MGRDKDEYDYEGDYDKWLTQKQIEEMENDCE